MPERKTKKYTSTKGWKMLMPTGSPTMHPERFVAPDGTVYRRLHGKEKRVDAILTSVWGKKYHLPPLKLRRYRSRLGVE